MNKTILLELNEFSLNLLAQYAHKYKHIQKMLEMNHIKLKIEDDYESNRLEPWVQWVSIHTGLSAKKHGIIHLGDIENLAAPQLWEKNNNLSVVWGCLNSKQGNANNNVLFFPDPWSKQKTNIRGVFNILSFLEIATGNRTSIPFFKIFVHMLASIFEYLKLLNIKVLKAVPLMLTVPTSSKAYVIAEYLNLLIFIKLVQSSKGNGILFINSLAHFQHHYWEPSKRKHLDWCLRAVDRMLRDLFSSNCELLICNGLSQENSFFEERWYSHVPKGGFGKLLELLNIEYENLRPCMSYDCIVEFKDTEQKTLAINAIRKCKVRDIETPLFLLDDYGKESLNLFIRLDFYGDKSQMLQIGNSSYKLSDLFLSSDVRTGRHIQECDLFFCGEKKTNLKFNYELYHLLEEKFDQA